MMSSMALDRLDADLLSRDGTDPEICHAFVTLPLSTKKTDPCVPLQWNGGGGLPAPASQLGDKADFTPSPLMGQAATGAA